MGHKEESRRTMEEISPNEEANVTNERSANFCLYHPCSLLQKFLGTFFICLGFQIPDAEENLDGKVLACEECSTSDDGQSFQLISTLIIRSGGPRRSDLSTGRGGRRRSDISAGRGGQRRSDLSTGRGGGRSGRIGRGPGINSEFL